MGLRENSAAAKDVQIKLKEEECARGMRRTALLMTCPLLLEQNSTRLWHFPVYPNNALLLLRMNKVPVYLQK